MPAYKYKSNAGKTLWYTSFHYTDWTGKNVRKVKRGFATRREALEYEAHFKDSQSKDPTILFSSLIRQYYADCETRLKPTTIQNKQAIIEGKILPYFANMRICDIDVSAVRKWQNVLLDYRDENGEPFAPTYLRSIHAQLSTIMNYACRFYHLPSNPAKLAGAIGDSFAPEKDFWTHDQFLRFREQEKKPAFLLAFDLLFYGGIREGELLALMPDDFNPEKQTVRIDANFAVVKGVDYLLTPKTKKSERIVTLPKTVFDEAMDYIGRTGVANQERIFYFKKNSLVREFKKCAERAGLPPIRVHDMRGSHASLLADIHTPIKEVADRLGHESVATTLRTYTHRYPHRAAELAGQIDSLIKENGQVSAGTGEGDEADQNGQKSTRKT